MLLVLLVLAAQEPPTAESRLKELEERLSALEKRSKALAEENARLDQRLADAKAARENHVRQAASAWVKRYGARAGIEETAGAGLEALWRSWLEEDFGKAADAKRWKDREAALRGALSADQATKLAEAVREDLVASAKLSIGSFTQAAKIPAERAPGFEKAVLDRLTFGAGVLLPQAHPEGAPGWFQVRDVVERSLPELGQVLAESEIAALRQTLEKWKPRRP